jgi:hypothetical protein
MRSRDFTPGALALASLLSLAAVPVRALPPDARLVLAPDSVKFIHPTFVLTGVASEPEGFVQVEILPGKEILITVPPGAKGVGTVMAFGSNRVFAWDVCVGPCLAETTLASAKDACPKLAESSEHVWAATVHDAKCTAALRQSLAHATVAVDKLQFSLDEPAALAFFKDVQAAIARDPKTKGIKAGYLGPTLQLSGEATTAALGRVLLHAYAHTVGRVTYDDSALTLTDRPSTEKSE